MQPYFMPYIGYFQLINAVDQFVSFDDVDFIKRGWINRNRILVQGEPHLFSIPIKDVSQHRKICDTKISHPEYENWKDKFFKTLKYNYKNAPNYEVVYELLEEILEADDEYISELALRSLKEVCDYLEVDTTIKKSSSCYENQKLNGKERIIDINLEEQADMYINAPGGKELYDKENFAEHDIKLRFLEPKEIKYEQFDNEFVPNLSVIDVLMFNDVETIRGMLEEYELV